jgi:hypothetical protein
VPRIVAVWQPDAAAFPPLEPGIDAAEKVVVRKQLRRGQMLAFPSMIASE